MSVAGGDVGKPAGRSKYQPAYCDAVRQFLGEGYSLAAFGGKIGVSYRTLKQWQKAHPAFAVAIRDGQAAAVLWWEEQLRRVAEKGGASGAVSAVIFGLKNRAPDEWNGPNPGEAGREAGEEPSSVAVFALPDNGRA